MAATVRIGGEEATCDGYHWTSSNKSLEKMLNAMLGQDGPSGADPNPDLAAALLSVEEVGGEVVRSDKAERVAGRIY